jgi:protein TonB
VLGGIDAAASGPPAGEPSPQAMVVRLAAQPEAAPVPVPAQPRRAAPTRYLSAGEVDERATPIEVPALVYPEKAYLNRLAGTVRMRIYISHDGRVDKADVLAASPRGHFEEAALDAVQRTRFRPARKDGRPVPSHKLIEVEFDPYGPTPEERS